MKHLQRIFLLLILVTFTFACKKDDDPAPLTKADMLAAKAWKLTNMTSSVALSGTIGGQPVTSTDVYNRFLPTCLKDNIISFRKDDKQYTLEDVGTSCGSDKILNFGSWLLSSDENTILMLGGVFLPFIFEGINSEELTITELTESSLKATTQVYLDEDTPTVITYTFIAQ